MLNNPLQINDWKFDQFIKSIILIQILVLIICGLSLHGINIPVFTQLIGFIYLTFAPGYLILRILKLHNLGNVKSVLYAAGLGITGTMFTGFLVNMIFPMLGILNPLSIVPLAIIMSLYVIILAFLSYIIDRDFNNPSFIDTEDLLSPLTLFLCIIPFLAIFGSYSVNFYNNNLISMLLFLLIALLAGLVVFNKIPGKFYPFIVWIISISLLYANTLISPHIWGWDIQNEYFLANMTLNNSYWDFNFADAYNAMLSVVILGPFYSIFTNMDLVHVFKIIYPFLFSLVPLGLYRLFKEQTSSKIAFLASFLFVSFSSFFMLMPFSGRGMIAQLFLILLLLVIFSERNRNSVVLLVIFSLGLVISHYSLTYFFFFVLISSFILLTLYHLYKWFIKSRDEDFIFIMRRSRINLFIIALIALFTYLWYGFLAGGMALRGFTDLLNVAKVYVFNNLDIFTLSGLTGILFILALFLAALRFRKNKIRRGSDLLNSLIDPVLESKSKYFLTAVLSVIILVVMAFLVGNPQTWVVAVLRYLNFVLVFFTLTGLSLTFLNIYKANKEYFALSIAAMVILITGIVFPIFERSFHITRIVQMTFIFLSPFCIIGGMMVFKSVIRSLNIDVSHETPLKLFSIFLVLFMLFNTGFFSVLTNTSIPVHLCRESDVFPRFNQYDLSGAQWLYKHNAGGNIYGDEHGALLFKKYFYYVPDLSLYKGENNSYIFSRKFNRENIFLLTIERGSKERTKTYKDMSDLINRKTKIYDNGGARVHYG
ncbi:MAG: DUF2206 domain-containing protein [Methanobacteriaceae archaeon]|jgi:uncharacterized membrane protein